MKMSERDATLLLDGLEALRRHGLMALGEAVLDGEEVAMDAARAAIAELDKLAARVEGATADSASEEQESAKEMVPELTGATSPESVKQSASEVIEGVDSEPVGDIAQESTAEGGSATLPEPEIEVTAGQEATSVPATVRVCSICGATVEDGEQFCAVCGTPVTSAESKRSCPSCHAAASEGDVFCANCGYDLRLPAQTPKLAVQSGSQSRCPTCGAEVQLDFAFCQVCGTKL